MLDDGDMDMLKVLKTLDEVGYEGCLNPDHYPLLDEKADPTRNAALAWSVGYVKALLSALPSNR
jgi:mannonate dehydratase